MYNKINKLKDAQFRRKTGVKRHTFNKMVEAVRESEEQRKKLLGRPLKLSYEDQVLMALEYLREYRTYFSLGQIYGLSELLQNMQKSGRYFNKIKGIQASKQKGCV